jgi:hypothetical protein
MGRTVFLLVAFALVGGALAGTLCASDPEVEEERTPPIWESEELDCVYIGDGKCVTDSDTFQMLPEATPGFESPWDTVPADSIVPMPQDTVIIPLDRRRWPKDDGIHERWPREEQSAPPSYEPPRVAPSGVSFTLASA